jgi:hypothetical protein
MTLETHNIEVRARDNASQVLRQIGQSATQAFDSMDRSASRFNVNRAELSAGLRQVQGMMSDFARAAAEEEAIFGRLEQAVEATGESYDKYATSIDAAVKKGEEMAFADDAVAKALGSMTQQMGSAEDALDNIALAMDVARARGISLNDAAILVGKVHEGNIGILNRYGIAVAEGTTATEALSLLQQRTAGQAVAYSNSQAGEIDRYRNALDNLTESIGSHTGGLQTLLALMPGVSAMWTATAALVGGLGGAGALMRLAGPAALIAGGGALAYGYMQESETGITGTTQTNEFWNNFFMKGAGVFNTLTPGSAMSKDKYINQMANNQTGDLINTFFGSPTAGATLGNANYIFGNPGMAAGGENFNEGELKAWIQQQAAMFGMSEWDYVNWVVTTNPNSVRSPNSGSYMGAGQLQSETLARSNMLSGTANPMLFSPGTSGLANAVQPTTALGSSATGATTSLVGGNAATEATAAANAHAQWTRAIEDTYGAYAGLVLGIDSAHDATSAFKATQDGLLETSSIFQQQQSEYAGVLGDMEAGYEILNQRKAEGVELSAEENEFLNNYASGSERMIGAVEDATVAQALLAGQYAENVQLSDDMKASTDNLTGGVGELVSVLELFILSLNNVPSEVKTEIYLDNIDYALSSIGAFSAMLAGLPSEKYVSVYTTFIDYAPGSVESPFMHGGLVSPAQHGRLSGGGLHLVGEGGPELVRLPGGSHVTPASATRARRQAGGDSGGMTIQNLIVYANDPMEFSNAMRSRGLAEARY